MPGTHLQHNFPTGAYTRLDYRLLPTGNAPRVL